MFDGLDPTFLLAAPIMAVSAFGAATLIWWINRPEKSSTSHRGAAVAPSRRPLVGAGSDVVSAATVQHLDLALVKVSAEFREQMRAQLWAFVAIAVALLGIGAAIGKFVL